MIWSDAVRLALRAITAHRLRSFLTLLGIAVGIAAVILLTSIGEGIHQFVLAEFTQFGTNVIGIAPGKTKTGGAPPSGIPTSVRPLTLDDARAGAGRQRHRRHAGDLGQLRSRGQWPAAPSSPASPGPASEMARPSPAAP